MIDIDAELVLFNEFERAHFDARYPQTGTKNVSGGQPDYDSVQEQFARARDWRVWQARATTTPAPAAPATDKLLTIIAYAYQIAGVHDAPEHILDVLADPEAATAEQVESMLPYQPAPAAPEGQAEAVAYMTSDRRHLIFADRYFKNHDNPLTAGLIPLFAAVPRQAAVAVEQPKLQPAEEYHEEYRDVVWFNFPSFCEPPEIYCGSPLEITPEFDDEHWTHFIRLDLNDIIGQAEAGAQIKRADGEA